MVAYIVCLFRRHEIIATEAGAKLSKYFLILQCFIIQSVEKTLFSVHFSFLCCDRDKHFKTSKEVSGVDMSEVKRFYKKINKNLTVYQKVRI